MYLTVPVSNQITGLSTSFVVPPNPPETGITFLWPGLEPLQNSKNAEPIGTGVLQPVLTWGGPACAPAAGKPTSLYSSWWISGQYVNTLGSQPGFMGCFSGDALLVKAGDMISVNMDLDLASGKWLQTISAEGRSVSFTFDLQGQAQNWVMFVIENYRGSNWAGPFTFLHTTVTFEKAAGDACRGWATTSGVHGVTSDAGGQECVIDSVVV